MLNILLAILVDAYSEVRGDAQYAPGVVEEMLSIGQGLMQNKKKMMTDLELSQMFQKMAWSNHRQHDTKDGVTTKNHIQKKGTCKQLCEATKLKAIPLPIVDTETQETILRVPVVKATGDQLIEFRIDESFIDDLLQTHLSNSIKPIDKEVAIKRMKAALLSRYAKEMTVEDAHKDNENDILTDDILQLKDIFQKRKRTLPRKE